jgi:hypothetical protein
MDLLPMTVSKAEKLTFEQQKWQDELAVLREELALKKREADLRELEMSSRRKKGEFSTLSNPLVISIFTVGLAGILNFAVALMNTTGMTELESFKSRRLEQIESDKSVRIMLSEVLKSPDHGELCRRMKAAYDVKFTDARAFIGPMEIFLQQQCVRPANPPNQPPVQTQPLQPRITVPFSTGWLGGGNNQGDQCKIGQAAVQGQYPGKTVILTGSSEQSRKDIIGRVTYKYFCNFDVM